VSKAAFSLLLSPFARATGDPPKLGEGGLSPSTAAVKREESFFIKISSSSHTAAVGEDKRRGLIKI